MLTDASAALCYPIKKVFKFQRSDFLGRQKPAHYGQGLVFSLTARSGICAGGSREGRHRGPHVAARALALKQRGAQAVEKIVRAASERDIKSIAERVESANAMAVLFQLGLDFMQGHYVNEPEVVLEDTENRKQTSLAELTAANAS